MLQQKLTGFIQFMLQVCSRNFIDGRPTKQNPAPALEMGYQPIVAHTPGRRPLKRRRLESTQPDDAVQETSSCAEGSSAEYTATHLNITTENLNNEECDTICCTKYPTHCNNKVNKPIMKEVSTQTVDIVALDHNYFYSPRTRTVGTQHSSPEFSVDHKIQSDHDSRFYTGLSLTVFMSLISNLSAFGEHLPYKMNISDQILAVLLRLRLALTFEDISRRFGVSCQLISSIYQAWIEIMSQHLSDCIVWLPRETIRRTLPKSFRESFPKTTCIIDCSEIFIQRPFSLKARAQTWSTYKGNNTAKFLIAIAPNGFIMFKACY